MHAQDPHVRTVLRYLGDVFRKRTHVYLATLANEFNGALLDDGKDLLWHIEYLTALRYARLVHRRQMVALITLHRQQMGYRLGLVRVNYLGRSASIILAGEARRR